MSCDAYRDLWTPFFTLFWRYWPDCPFPVYLGSNHAQFPHPRVTTLNAGTHCWSAELKAHLSQIDAQYVLLLLEDFFFTCTIDTGDIVDLLRTLHGLHGTVLRLYPLPGPDQPLASDESVGQISQFASFRVSTQAAIWKKSGLAELLPDNETPWDFEVEGTIRSQAHPDGFYATYDTVMPYEQVVERGQWFRSSADYFKHQQIGCDFSARPVMSPATALKKAINRFRKNSIARIKAASSSGS